jgi:membrane protein implicated in regulation of membrane protease activity
MNWLKAGFKYWVDHPVFNRDQVAGIARIAIPALLTWIAARGVPILGETSIQVQIIAWVVAAVAAIWSWRTHSDAGKLKQVGTIKPPVTVEVPEEVIEKSIGVKKIIADNTKYPNIKSMPTPP